MGKKVMRLFLVAGAISALLASQALSGSFPSAPLYPSFASSSRGTFTRFDVPGASSTWAYGINDKGAVAGEYFDANDVVHGFVRAVDGTVAKFSIAGAGKDNASGTLVVGINRSGTVAGYDWDKKGIGHGFVRTPGGTITTFDAPNAGTAPNAGQGTRASAINDQGVITGYFQDKSGTVHGYLRAANGRITTFTVSGAGTEPYQGTYPASISPKSVVTGYYLDSQSRYHGFVRAANGSIATFDVPQCGRGFEEGTLGQGINNGDTAVGYCILQDDSHETGFIRAADGTITTFRAKSLAQTHATSINNAGTVTGFYYEGNSVDRGFVRTQDGRIANSLCLEQERRTTSPAAFRKASILPVQSRAITPTTPASSMALSGSHKPALTSSQRYLALAI